MTSATRNPVPKPELLESNTELHNEHQLVSALRDVLAHPQQHTVGGLSQIILNSLAELSLLKDRLELLTHDTNSEGGSAAPASIASTGPEPCRPEKDSGLQSKD